MTRSRLFHTRLLHTWLLRPGLRLPDGFLGAANAFAVLLFPVLVLLLLLHALLLVILLPLQALLNFRLALLLPLFNRTPRHLLTQPIHLRGLLRGLHAGFSRAGRPGAPVRIGRMRTRGDGRGPFHA